MWKSIRNQFLLGFFHAVLLNSDDAQGRVAGIVINPNPYEPAHHYETDSATFFRVAAKNLLCIESAVYLAKRLFVGLLTTLTVGLSSASSILLLYLFISYFNSPENTVIKLIEIANVESLRNLLKMLLLFSVLFAALTLYHRFIADGVNPKSYRFNRRMKLLIELRAADSFSEVRY